MNPVISNKVSSSHHHSQLHHASSVKAFKNMQQSISISPDESSKKLVNFKTRSPKGWTNWTDSSKVEQCAIQKPIKLPPIDLEIKRPSIVTSTISSSVKAFPLPIPERKQFKVRGSLILEDQQLYPRELYKSEEDKSKEPEDDPDSNHEYKHRGSIVFEESIFNQNQIVNLQKNHIIPRKSTIINDSSQLINVITRCGYKTRIGSVMGKAKKHNQDNWLISHQIQGNKGQFLLAVCDGHGDKGHKVSLLIKQNLTKTIEECLSENNDPSNIELNFTEGIKRTVEVVENSDIDLMFSGSTLVTILIRGNKLWCGNIGDSRAIIGNKDKNERWYPVEISYDQKPSRPDEAARIRNAGGVVRQFQSNSGESYGPLRVWSIQKNVPGLAMTRSIGDIASKQNGIISEPEITTRILTKHDKFLIVATDGIWEFISNQEAVDIVKELWVLGKSEACCEKLLDIARERWQKENIVDDITVLVAFLNVR